MRSDRAQKTRQFFAAVTVVVALLLGACGNSSDNDTGDGDSSSVFVYTPVDGLPLADGASSLEAISGSYFLTEDTSFSGRLIFFRPVLINDDPEGEGESDLPDDALPEPSDPVFVVTRPPRSGSVSIEEMSGAFDYTPEADFFGKDSFAFYVVEGDRGSLQATIELVVSGVNDAPELTVEIDKVAEQGGVYESSLIAIDADNDPLTFSSQNLPDWLELDSETGLLSGIPDQLDIGIYRQMTLSVSDPSGETDTYGPFSLEVIDINDSPTVNPAQFPDVLKARERVVVNLFPDDPDGEFVSIQTELNDFVDVEILGGSLAVTARDVTEVTPINLVVIARDLRGTTTREIISLKILPVTESGMGLTLSGRKRGVGFHLVVLGDGYKSDEQISFMEDVDGLMNLMQRDPAIAAHLSGWNIHAVSVASEDSGIDDNVSNDIRHTAFDSGYFCRDVARLVCANDAKVFDAALDEYPYLDQIVLLVNDSRYGGSGGNIAVASANAPQIALHEMGHSVAALADEYVDSLIPSSTTVGFVEGRFANVSGHANPRAVPWSHWIEDPDDYPSLEGEPGIGVFEGGFYQDRGFYRPTSTSRMRDNERNFGAVNGEQWALSIYQRTNPIVSFEPVLRQIQLEAGETQVFGVLPLFGDDVQLIEWSLDGRSLPAFQNETELSLSFDEGDYTVALEVSDITGRIRIPPPHAASFEWKWQVRVVE